MASIVDTEKSKMLALRAMSMIIGGMDKYDACNEVGISVVKLGRVLSRNTELVASLREMILASSMSRIFELNESIDKGLKLLMDDLVDPSVNPSRRLDIVKFLMGRLDRLSDGIGTDMSSDAKKYLETPLLKKARNKFHDDTTITVTGDNVESVSVNMKDTPPIIDITPIESDQ